jgi:hypothetical protein
VHLEPFPNHAGLAKIALQELRREAIAIHLDDSRSAPRVRTKHPDFVNLNPIADRHRRFSVVIGHRG